MPVRSRSADDAPKRTPSFVCEVPLRLSPAQERILLARLEAARQVGATCLGEARKRVQLVRESKAFQRARTLARDDPERRGSFERLERSTPSRTSRCRRMPSNWGTPGSLSIWT